MDPMQVALEGVELRLVRLPLATPFRSAHGVRHDREVVIVRALATDGPDGWGECVAEPEPTYWPEYTAAALHVLEHHLVPRILAGRPLGEVRGHAMAKAAIEGAVIDAGLRAEGRSMAEFLGATRSRVLTGIALGIAGSVGELVASACRWHDDGHRAFKLKIAPDWHVDPVRAVRKALGDEVALILDANGSFRSDHPEDLAILRRLDDPVLRVMALEQPFAPDDLVGHARLVREVDTLVCLDESIGSLGDVETALALAACDAISLKVGRVGGLVEAIRIHERCRQQAIDLRCGGMLETGLGRALNLAVAALPGCTLPPDLAPSSRYFAEDLTVPFDALSGTMNVPGGPGLGVDPLPDVLESTTVSRTLLRASP
jgi:O-succinylbenzoate synthase